MRPAVFLDKDGTLINDVPYNVDISKIIFADHAFEALKQMQSAGYDLFIITNQPGIAFNYYNEEALINCINYIIETLRDNGIVLKGYYYCPHHPQGVNEFQKVCSCRKPLDGLIRTAAYEHDIDLSASWMIGDILNDTEAGNRAGCKTILIDNGNETEWKYNQTNKPGFIVPHLKAATDIIIKQSAMHELETV